MAEKIYFIDEQGLKELTSIEDNLNPGELVPFIRQAQDLNIEFVIGKALCDELKNQIVNDSITDKNQLLLDEYIRPCLAHYSAYYSIPFLALKISNAGLVLKGVGSTGDIADKDRVNQILALQKNIAEAYSQKMLTFLCENINDYPLYRDSRTSNEKKYGQGGYFTGLVLTPTKKNNYNIFGINNK